MVASHERIKELSEEYAWRLAEIAAMRTREEKTGDARLLAVFGAIIGAGSFLAMIFGGSGYGSLGVVVGNWLWHMALG